MAIKDSWRRLLSRKSLSSGHSSDSSSSADLQDVPCPTTPFSSGTVTPVSVTAQSQLPVLTNINTNRTSLSKSPGSSLLSKTLTWRSSHGATGSSPSSRLARKEKKAAEKTPAQVPRRGLHPSERPLTEANLRQQEMLSHFTFEFGRGRRRGSVGAWSVESGISPCTSRRVSMALPPTE